MQHICSARICVGQLYTQGVQTPSQLTREVEESTLHTFGMEPISVNLEKAGVVCFTRRQSSPCCQSATLPFNHVCVHIWWIWREQTVFMTWGIKQQCPICSKSVILCARVFVYLCCCAFAYLWIFEFGERARCWLWHESKQARPTLPIRRLLSNNNSGQGGQKIRGAKTFWPANANRLSPWIPFSNVQLNNVYHEFGPHRLKFHQN